MLVLIIIYKESGFISRRWSSIREGFPPWFVKRVIKLLGGTILTTGFKLPREHEATNPLTEVELVF